MIEKIFDGANVGYLAVAAEEIGLDVNVPPDIREAQRLKELGVPVPGDLDPEEAYFLLEITRQIEETGEVPRDFVFYLNDRVGTDIPEGVLGLVRRKNKAAYRNLVSAVDEISSEIHTNLG